MWSFVVTDRNGVPLGELREASTRRLRVALNRIPTFTFNVDVDNPQGAALLQSDRALIKGYDDSSGAKVLDYLGPVVGYTKKRAGGESLLSITSAGVAWRLGHRLIGKSFAGATFGTNPGVPGSWLDRGEMAGRIIDALNAGEAINVFTDANDTGIRRGAIAATALSSAGPWRYKPADEAISEFSAPLDGFDWEVAPVEPAVDALGVQIGALNIAAAIGSFKPNIAWEYGQGKRNVDNWVDISDSGGLCNRGINLPPGFPDDQTRQPIQISDATSIAERGLHEAVIPGDLLVDELRTSLVQEHVKIRKLPRRVISFEPIVDNALDARRRVPRYGTDFITGDVMPFRATETFKTVNSDGTITGQVEVKTIDALFRAFVVDLEIGDDDTVKPTVTLVQEGS